MKNTIRWIFYCPIGMICFILCALITPYILGLLFNIMSFIMFGGSKYEFAIQPTFDFEYAIKDFEIFLTTTCLGMIVSGAISGAIARYISPKTNHHIIVTILYAIPLAILLLLLGLASWDAEHWFYSICMEITWAITWGVICLFVFGLNENK